MKALCKVLLSVALVAAGMSPAHADSAQGGDITGIGSQPFSVVLATGNTASVGSFGAGSLIFGFKLYANDAGDSCGLYDSATLAGAGNAQLIDENFEPTDEDVTFQMWPRPFKLVTDLTVVTNGNCLIYYQ